MADRSTYPPSSDFVKRAHVPGLESYRELYQRAAANPNGDVGRARGWARQAAALARTTDEASRAAELQVLLAHEAGDYQVEIEQARRWVALAPGSPVARMVLKRAQNWHGLQDCLPDGTKRRTASARK